MSRGRGHEGSYNGEPILLFTHTLAPILSHRGIKPIGRNNKYIYPKNQGYQMVFPQFSLVHIFEFFWYFAFISGLYFLARKNGIFESALFFLPALVWGYFVEYFGLKLYNLYYYPDHYLFYFEGVPISIAAGWAVLAFFGYYVTTNKLHVAKKVNIYSESAIFPTIVDFLIIEPLAFFLRLWVWVQNDFWFGAPLFNFVGWLFAISIYVAIYNGVTTTYKDKLQRVTAITIAIFLGMVLLQIVGLGFIHFFGAI